MDTVAFVRRSLSTDAEQTFSERVDRQADRLKRAIADGAFDSDGLSVGLELEATVLDQSGDAPVTLGRVPDAAFSTAGVAPELGVHNLEVNAAPAPLSTSGLRRQRSQIADAIDAARRAVGPTRDLALSGMAPAPAADGTVAYLSAVEDRDGVTVARNMHADPRYIAIDNDSLRRAGGSIPFSVPGFEHAFPTILFESLATSIQPHVLVPEAEALPRALAAAIRTLGPVLSLSTNSPLLPADCYTGADPEAVLADTHHELRIAAFEQSVNHTDRPKVAVPADVTAPGDAVDAIAGDDTLAPVLFEWLREASEDRSGLDVYWELRHKRGLFWRWVRPVFGGDPVAGICDQQSIRIEYRPLPTQPTVSETVGLTALVAGVIHGIVVTDHPVLDLERAAAESCFYDVVENGPTADLAWIDRDGEPLTDRDRVWADLFRTARAGLADADVDSSDADDLLAPIERRAETGVVPSQWLLDRCEAALDGGRSFPEAIRTAQAAYRQRARSGRPVAEWSVE
ncbi:hypothetical protein [Halococcoides cellulosivorans]|uniref:Glutamate--cysteine ligase n=1 Tax=Halococcoides cellulosivorans TaxID=1679096 RepID=A0A2R4X1M7_9EURY|nr:hypothetical protein [Halococcoides cellulosivorans]AWB27704.1 hypothetical protein HARCEL1_08275 [Halococcoides cellulosivorans]